MSAKKEVKAATAVAGKKIVNIIPAAPGMLAHYAGKNHEDQPINAAKQVACLALMLHDDETTSIEVITLDDLSAFNAGKPYDADSGMVLDKVSI